MKNFTATKEDIARLEGLYEGRAVCYGDMHGHSAATEYSDGKFTLAQWKEHLLEAKLDFASIVDHRQTLHMQHPDWDNAVFLGGSEPEILITDTAVENRNNIDYAMIFTDLADFEAYLKCYPEEYPCAKGVQGLFPYKFQADHPKIARMIRSIKDHGGMFVYVHPLDKGYYDPVDFRDRWFADETGFEVTNKILGDVDCEANVAAYRCWVALLGEGRRLWATSGSDAHGTLTKTLSHTTLYADRKNAKGYFARMRVGDITAGPAGIRIAVGDAITGSVGSFAGNRVVVAAGDLHPALPTDHTYRLDIYDENGLVTSQPLDPNKMNYFAFDAAADAKFYRANVYDATEDKRLAVGNPVWNQK